MAKNGSTVPVKVIKLDKKLVGYDCPFKYDFYINDRDKSECCSVLDGRIVLAREMRHFVLLENTGK